MEHIIPMLVLISSYIQTPTICKCAPIPLESSSTLLNLLELHRLPPQSHIDLIPH